MGSTRDGRLVSHGWRLHDETAHANGGMMDPTTKALIETTGAAGYVIHLDHAGNGTMAVTAIDEKTGERWVVRDADLYAAVVQVAEKVGIDLHE